MTKLIYIGGYGRSGTTLLEYLLTTSRAVCALGEVVSVSRKRPTKKKKCTCGRLISGCPEWRFLYQRSDKESWDHSTLVAALLGNACQRYAALIDSSKTSWGSLTAPFDFRRKLHGRFQLVHIVRNPRAVCWSAMKKSQRSHSPFASYALRCCRSAFGWWTANLACEAFYWFHPQEYLRVRYEDLVASPKELIGRVFEIVLPEIGYQFTELGNSDNRHQLYGNRMRNQALLLSDVHEDVVWKTEMPARYQKLVSCLTWPLRRRYSY